MTYDNDLYFEISDNENLVRLEPIELVNINSTLDWDNSFIKTKIILKGGAFSGQYIAYIMTVDFEKFKQETPFHPNWGLERAQQSLKNCK